MMTDVKPDIEKKINTDIPPDSANLLLNIYLSEWTHPINMTKYRYPACFLKPERYSENNLEYLLDNNLVSVKSTTNGNICWENMVLKNNGNYINEKDKVIEHFNELTGINISGTTESNQTFYLELTQKGIKIKHDLEKFYRCITEDTPMNPRKNLKRYAALKNKGINITISTADNPEQIPKIFKEPYDLTELFTASDHKLIGYYGKKDINLDSLRTRLCLKNEYLQ